MKIKIGGSEYDFVMNGTVGILYLAERFLNDGETLDLAGNNYHSCLVYYSVLATSNKEYPTLEEFLAGLTGDTVRAMSDYVSKRWSELEGLPREGDAADKKKD